MTEVNCDVVRLSVADAGELLTLQRAAYVPQAILHDDLSLPPLTQTFEQLITELQDAAVIALGIRIGGRLIGSVRLRIRGSTAELGRLIVAPDLQGGGIGTRLLAAAAEQTPPGVARIELFTGERSLDNIRLYERNGYSETRRESAGNYDLVFMARSCGEDVRER